MIALFCCLGGYYIYAKYNINEKLIKSRPHSHNVDGVGMGSLFKRDSEDSSRSSVSAAEQQHHKKVFTDPTNFVIDIFTCACCYEEYN